MITQKDWIEDSSFKSDYVLCICCICKEQFYGYKHRIICKICGDLLKLKQT